MYFWQKVGMGGTSRDEVMVRADKQWWIMGLCVALTLTFLPCFHFGPARPSLWVWLLVALRKWLMKCWVAQYLMPTGNQVCIIFLFIMNCPIHHHVHDISTCKSMTNQSPMCPPPILRAELPIPCKTSSLSSLSYTLSSPLRSWPLLWTF